MSMLRKMLESDSALDIYQQYRGQNKKNKTDQHGDSIQVALFTCIAKLLDESLSTSTVSHEGQFYLNIEKKTKDIKPQWGWYNSRKLVVSETGVCQLFILHEVSSVSNIWDGEVLDEEGLRKFLDKLGDDYTWCRGMKPEIVTNCDKEFHSRTVPYPHVTSVDCSRLILSNRNAKNMLCINCSKLNYHLSRRREAESDKLLGQVSKRCQSEVQAKKSRLFLKKRNTLQQKVEGDFDGFVCHQHTQELEEIQKHGLISDNSIDKLKQLLINEHLQLWNGESESCGSSLEDMSLEDEEGSTA